MLNFSAVRRIFVARQAQDMRRGIDMLAGAVVRELAGDPYAGDAFVFLSRDRRKLKVLVWEDGGFWLCLKRLEAGTFAKVAAWSVSTAVAVVVTPAQMYALLEGIDVKHAAFRVRQRVAGVDSSRRFGRYRHGRDDSCRASEADGGRGDGSTGGGAHAGEGDNPCVAGEIVRGEG